MSANTTRKGTSAGSLIAMAVVGAILMVGGTMISLQNPSFMSWEEGLAEQGIPIDLGASIAVIGVFLILFKVLDIFFFTPLHDAIDGRTTELENTFSEAENLRTEMAQLKSDYEKRLADTEASAREQIQAQIKEAQDLKKTLMADAQTQADAYKKSAMEEIDSEKNKILSELRIHVADLSLKATEKILNANIDQERNRKLVDEFLDTVEVKN